VFYQSCTTQIASARTSVPRNPRHDVYSEILQVPHDFIAMFASTFRTIVDAAKRARKSTSLPASRCVIRCERLELPVRICFTKSESRKSVITWSDEWIQKIIGATRKLQG
jgi:hypothetical protein